jgi:hypothetical protein
MSDDAVMEFEPPEKSINDTILVEKKCVMCGQINIQLFTHHVIPRVYGGDDSDTIQICRKCHGKADGKFRDLIYDPNNEARYWKDRNKHNEYARKTICQRAIFYMPCEDKTGISVTISYNKRIDRINIHSGRHNTGKCKGRYDFKSIYNLNPEPHVRYNVMVTQHQKSGSIRILGAIHHRRYRKQLTNVYRISKIRIGGK